MWCWPQLRQMGIPTTLDHLPACEEDPGKISIEKHLVSYRTKISYTHLMEKLKLDEQWMTYVHYTIKLEHQSQFLFFFFPHIVIRRGASFSLSSKETNLNVRLTICDQFELERDGKKITFKRVQVDSLNFRFTNYQSVIEDSRAIWNNPITTLSSNKRSITKIQFINRNQKHTTESTTANIYSHFDAEKWSATKQKSPHNIHQHACMCTDRGNKVWGLSVRSYRKIPCEI